jgi:polar amino acid transport system substrate-binding protein
MGGHRWRMRIAAVGAVASFAWGCAGSRDAAGEFTPVTPGVLTVATNLPAPGFWEGSLEDLTGGFEYGIARELASRFDLRLEVVDVPFGDLVSGELHGADLALAQVTVTSEREEHLTFSVPYFPANMGILVREGDRIDDLADARDSTWAVQRSTTEEDFVDDVIRPKGEPVRLDSIDAVVAAVRDGDVDAGLLDLPTALVSANRSDRQLDVTAQFVTTQQMAIAMPDDTDDKEAVDSAMRALSASGDLDDLVRRELEPALGRDPDAVRRIVARVG